MNRVYLFAVIALLLAMVYFATASPAKPKPKPFPKRNPNPLGIRNRNRNPIPFPDTDMEERRNRTVAEKKPERVQCNDGGNNDRKEDPGHGARSGTSRVSFGHRPRTKWERLARQTKYTARGRCEKAPMQPPINDLKKIEVKKNVKVPEKRNKRGEDDNPDGNKRGEDDNPDDNPDGPCVKGPFPEGPCIKGPFPEGPLPIGPFPIDPFSKNPFPKGCFPKGFDPKDAFKSTTTTTTTTTPRPIHKVVRPRPPANSMNHIDQGEGVNNPSAKEAKRDECKDPSCPKKPPYNRAFNPPGKKPRRSQ